MKNVKVAIVGSRGFNDYELLIHDINKLKEDQDLNIIEIVSGGAKGADSLGKKYAIENNIKLTEFIPDWNKYGPRAGHIRNRDIVENADVVCAWWDQKSTGTKGSIDLAREMNKPLHIYFYSEEIKKSICVACILEKKKGSSPKIIKHTCKNDK